MCVTRLFFHPFCGTVTWSSNCHYCGSWFHPWDSGSAHEKCGFTALPGGLPVITSPGQVTVFIGKFKVTQPLYLQMLLAPDRGILVWGFSRKKGRHIVQNKASVYYGLWDYLYKLNLLLLIRSFGLMSMYIVQLCAITLVSAIPYFGIIVLQLFDLSTCILFKGL